MDNLDKKTQDGLFEEKSNLVSANKRLSSEISEWKGKKHEIDEKIGDLEAEIAENTRRIDAIQHIFNEFKDENTPKTRVERRRY